MREIQVQKREIDIKEYIRRPAQREDYDLHINEDVKIMEGEKLLCVYMTLPEKNMNVLNSIRSLKYGTNKRTSGLLSTSRIFGYSPRETIRKDYCSSTVMARENPRQHSIICGYGASLAKYYKETCPEMYAYHTALADEKILPEWKIKESPFTSGIINKDNQLNYHFDAGNLTNVYSNMIAYKKDVSGGFLSMPEYNIGLEISDNSVTFFDGQNILHGVTPFHKLDQGAYRYTIVYYTLKRMWSCQQVTEEVARIRKVRTERERKRIARMHGEINDLEQKKPEDSTNYKLFVELGIPLEYIATPPSRIPEQYRKKIFDYNKLHGDKKE